MSDGLLPFKGLAWGAAAIAIGVAVIPTGSNFSFDSLRTTLRTKKPGGGTTTGTGGTTTGTGGTTTGGTTTTTTGTTTTAAGYPELTMVPSNFDVNSELVPAWGTGAIPGKDSVV